MADASIRLRKLVVTPRETNRPFLIVDVEITLPQGVITFQLPGSVVATLVEHLGLIQQEHPELCGARGVVRERVDWVGEVDPGKVGMN